MINLSAYQKLAKGELQRLLQGEEEVPRKASLAQV
jgi:hypothetical protein